MSVLFPSQAHKRQCPSFFSSQITKAAKESLFSLPVHRHKRVNKRTPESKKRQQGRSFVSPRSGDSLSHLVQKAATASRPFFSLSSRKSARYLSTTTRDALCPVLYIYTLTPLQLHPWFRRRTTVLQTPQKTAEGDTFLTAAKPVYSRSANREL